MMSSLFFFLNISEKEHSSVLSQSCQLWVHIHLLTQLAAVQLFGPANCSPVGSSQRKPFHPAVGTERTINRHYNLCILRNSQLHNSAQQIYYNKHFSKLFQSCYFYHVLSHIRKDLAVVFILQLDLHLWAQFRHRHYIFCCHWVQFCHSFSTLASLKFSKEYPVTLA